MAFLVISPDSCKIRLPAIFHCSGYVTNRKISFKIQAQKEGKTSFISENFKLLDLNPLITANNVHQINIDLKSDLRKPIVEIDIRAPKLLENDGYGTVTVKDYLEMAKDLIKPDGGPPRWFCPVDCGRPMKDAPLLLFLPGMDGIGLGLLLHHKSLGRVFEVRCMHIPVQDRTSIEGLVKFVENSIKFEHALSPHRPIYLIGDSFGGCLALSVAARNPSIDLVLILSNPATSFKNSQLQAFLPVLEALPEILHVSVPYLLSFLIGDPLKLAAVGIEKDFQLHTVDKLTSNLVSLLPQLLVLADIIPKETLLWKLKLLREASAYSNSRLHAVKAHVLLLASGNDNMLPSRNEAERLHASLQNCKVRYFKDNGHTLLLENGMNLLTIIKGATMYRRFAKHDFVMDFLPPSLSEFHVAVQQNGLFRTITSPVMLSTQADGNIVRGLSGVPDEGPVLLVGYHMLMGLELGALVEEFIREKKVLVRGVAHPILFGMNLESSLQEVSYLDVMRLFGALPVSATNLYRLLSTKSFVLLYPGGAREALHQKGEEYKLFWPEKPEFIRMAAHFGATIVPFGVVGEDDIAELALDYNDMMRIPLLKSWVQKFNRDNPRLRIGVDGEVGNQDLFLPGLLPKIPGRFYYLFGKPIETKGKKKMLKEKDNANALYLHVKSEITRLISYLKEKRQSDPYRGIVQRTIYEATMGSTDQIPTFNDSK